MEGLIFGFLWKFTVLRKQHCFSFCDEKMNYKCFFCRNNGSVFQKVRNWIKAL